ncbi:MAG TPA: histidine kinase, partial [Actinophytocola sp.]|uniref:sensor histidine kinase n=1 Tax=Actinophytocola sp. TaxID=1872138 RepID=UPI002F923943
MESDLTLPTRTGGDGARRLPRAAPKLAMAVLVTVFVGFGVVSSIALLSTPGFDFASTVLSLIYTAALLVLQIGYFGRPARHRGAPAKYLALLAQAALVYLPLLQYGQAWVSRPGFLAGSVLLCLPAAAGVPLFVGIVASMGAAQAAMTGSGADVAYTTVSTVITGLVVFGLTWLANLVVELDSAREELAQLAVARERLRFARDLHDLLGLSLSAITLKSELTRRLITDQPAEAKEELGEILGISRKALADVRSVASGYRRLSLDDECDSAESVLATANVAVTLRREYQKLPAETGTLLATVLREGITNVLRHSEAEQCAIEIRQHDDTVAIEIVNDGACAKAATGGG